MAIDPGGTTGMAIWMENDNIGTISIPSHDDTIDHVLNMMFEYTPEVVIVEQFITRGLISSYGLKTIELVGAIKTVVYLSNKNSYGPNLWCPTLIRRTPGQRITFVPSARKFLVDRRTRLRISFTDHEMDALAHLLGYKQSIERGVSSVN